MTTLREDVNNVVDDIRTRGFQRAVGGTLSSLEAFYLTDQDRRELAEMPPLRHWFRRVLWFIRGLLMKLTPARRIMLAAALLFFILGIQRVEFEAFRATFRFQPIGTLLILTVLTLELKDKLMARDELEAGRQVQLALMPKAARRSPGGTSGSTRSPRTTWAATSSIICRSDVGVIASRSATSPARHSPPRSSRSSCRRRCARSVPSSKRSAISAPPSTASCTATACRRASRRWSTSSSRPSRAEIRILNAGHMPPLVVRGASVTTLERGGIVLGIMPDSTYTEQRVELAPGEVLIAYSDGVSEATNEQGDFFGDERLHRVALAASGLSAKAIGLEILDDVRRFLSREAPNDDISLMVLKRPRAV